MSAERYGSLESWAVYPERLCRRVNVRLDRHWMV